MIRLFNILAVALLVVAAAYMATKATTGYARWFGQQIERAK